MLGRASGVFFEQFRKAIHAPAGRDPRAWHHSSRGRKVFRPAPPRVRAASPAGQRRGCRARRARCRNASRRAARNAVSAARSVARDAWTARASANNSDSPADGELQIGARKPSGKPAMLQASPNSNPAARSAPRFVTAMPIDTAHTPQAGCCRASSTDCSAAWVEARERPRHAFARGMRHDHIVDEALLSGHKMGWRSGPRSPSSAMPILSASPNSPR